MTVDRRYLWDVKPDVYWEEAGHAEQYIKTVPLHCGRYDAIEMIKEAMKNKRSLDVGCGPRALGALSNLDLFLRSDLKATANFVLGSAQTMPYQDNTFDVVSMLEVIEHVHDPTRVLTECRRVLREGGTLHLTTPNMANLSFTLRYLLNRRIRIHPDHRCGWVWEMLVWLLKLNGFSDIHVYTWGFVDEMRKEGVKLKLPRSYRLCNLLSDMGFRFPFLYLNIYCKGVKNSLEGK